MQNRPPVGHDDPTWPGYATPQPQQRVQLGWRPISPSTQPTQSISPPSTYQQPPQGVRYPIRPSFATVSRSLSSLSQLVSVVLALIEGLLIMRIVLLLLAANPDAGFSSWIYGLSAPLVAPFQGVFPSIGGWGHLLDMSAILAIVVYAIIARVAETVLRLLARL